MSPPFWDDLFTAISMVGEAAVLIFALYIIATQLRILQEPHVVILSTFVIRILVIYAQQVHPFLPIKRDPAMYDRLGTALAHGTDFSVLSDYLMQWGGPNVYGQAGHILNTAIVMSIFGSYDHVMPILNSFLLCVAAFLFLDLIQKSDLLYAIRWWAAMLFALAIFFYPGGLLTGVYGGRDPVVSFSFVLAVHAMCSKKRIFSFQFILGAFEFVFLRTTNVVFIASAVFIFFLIYAPPGKRVQQLVVGAIMGFMFLVGAVMFRASLAQAASASFLQNLAENQMDAENDNPYPIKMDVSTMSGFLEFLFVKLFYVLYYPFPWELPKQATVLDTTYTLIVTPILAYGLFWGFPLYRRRLLSSDAGQLVIYSLATGMICIGGLAIISPTPTATQRYRIPFVYLMDMGMALTLAPGFARSRSIFQSAPQIRPVPAGLRVAGLLPHEPN